MSKLSNLSKTKLQAIRAQFQSMDRLEREDWLRKLSIEELRGIYQYPDIFLFDKQIIEGEDWIYYLLRCGRSFGKSYAGAAWIAKKIRNGAKVVGLCGPTYDDVAKVMVPAILKWFLPDELEDPPYNNQTHTVRFNNGAVIYCYTSDKETRGPNLEYLWCDEICVWADGIPEKIQERFQHICRAVRAGKHPQVIITSTPKNHPFFVDFQKKIDEGNPNYKMIQGSILDNPNLPKSYVNEQIANCYTTADRMELFGDLITETPGAFWTHDQLDLCKADLPSPLNAPPPSRKRLTNAQLMGKEPIILHTDKPYHIRTVIGFDPSGSVDRDECGIVVVALYSDGKAYVLHDASGDYNPAEYAKKIADLYQQYHAACVVVESNYGGKGAFLYILRSVNALMNIKTVNTHVGKTTRAEHVSALYHQGKVFHVNHVDPTHFNKLEDQMCTFNIHYSKSPDRLDSLVYAITELFFPQSSAHKTLTIKNLPQF